MDAAKRNQVEALVKKAAEAANSSEAMAFSQAACNAANALRVLLDIERTEKLP